MKGKNLLITLALSAVLFTGCGIKSAQTIIKVNDTKITQAQFDELFDKQAKAGLAGLTKVDIKNPKNAFLYNLTKNKVVKKGKFVLTMSKSEYKWYSIILFFLQFVILTFFLEIFEFNFCRLNQNTKRNIEERGSITMVMRDSVSSENSKIDIEDYYI